MPELQTDPSCQRLIFDRRAWRLIARDALLLYLFTFWGGVVLGLSGFSPTPSNLTLFALVSAALLVIGFAISGYTTRYERRRYLPSVAGLLWLYCVVNVALGFETLSGWLFSLVPYLLYAALGGTIALLLARCMWPRSFPRITTARHL
jgi:hypothetical protein